MNRQTALNLTLLAVVSLICLGSCEIATRWLLGNQIVLFPRYHTSAQYGEFTLRRLRPNSEFWHTNRDGSWKFVTNAQGFRSDEDFHIEKPPGVFRVMALGDSMTEGFEVPQSATYSAVLERYLRLKGIKAEIFNTGISGFGTAEELIYLENEGIKYMPDAVVLGFFSNDFDDNVRSNLFRLAENKLVVANKIYIPGVRILDAIDAIAPLRWLSESSYFYSFAMNTIWDAVKRARLRSSEYWSENELTVPTSIDDYKVNLEIALLQRLYAFCHAHHVMFIIVDIPQEIAGKNSEPDFLPSVSAALQSQFHENSDALILSEDVFAPYRGLARLYGFTHINEFSHSMLGIAVGDKICALLGRGKCNNEVM